MKSKHIQEIRDRNHYFYLTDKNHEHPFDSLKDIIQDSLDNNKTMEFEQIYRSMYSEFNTRVPIAIIKQYLKFMKKV